MKGERKVKEKEKKKTKWPIWNKFGPQAKWRVIWTEDIGTFAIQRK